MEEYNEQGYLSLDTLKQIMDNGLLDYLDFQDGKLVANTKSLNKMAEAKRNAASAALAEAMANDFVAIADGRLKDASLLAQSAVEGLGNKSEVSGNKADASSGKFINFFDLKLTFFLFPCITVPVYISFERINLTVDCCHKP